MHATEHDIQQLIAVGNVAEARILLRAALQNAPGAEIYYLASQVALDSPQRAQFLQRCLAVDPFHEQAFAALHGSAPALSPPAPPPSQAPVAHTPVRIPHPSPAPRPYAPAPLRPTSMTHTAQSSSRGAGIIFILIGLAALGGVIFIVRGTAEQSAGRQATATPIRQAAVVAPIPTPTQTPHQRAMDASSATSPCGYDIQPRSGGYFSAPSDGLFHLDTNGTFLIVETLSEASDAFIEVQQSDGTKLRAPTYALARRSDESGGQQIYYRYYGYHLGTKTKPKAGRSTVFIAVPPVMQLRFRCIEAATVNAYMDEIALPHLFNIDFLFELGKINSLVSDVCGERSSSRCR